MSAQFTSFAVNSTTALQPFKNFRPSEAGSLYFSVEGSDVRFMYHGGLPTRDNGHRLYNGQSTSLNKADEVLNFAVIAQSGTATVSCTVGGQ
jgi:hypothetical protein